MDETDKDKLIDKNKSASETENIEETKKIKNPITIAAIAVAIMLISGFFCCGGSSLFEKSPTSAPRPASETITVKSGELRSVIQNYSGTITKNTIINVRKSDGTLDTREDDLKELCLDFNYYQNQIIKHTAAGNENKAQNARDSWNKTNLWLEEYDYDDVAFMFTLIKEKGW